MIYIIPFFDTWNNNFGKIKIRVINCFTAKTIIQLFNYCLFWLSKNASTEIVAIFISELSKAKNEKF